MSGNNRGVGLIGESYDRLPSHTFAEDDPSPEGTHIATEFDMKKPSMQIGLGFALGAGIGIAVAVALGSGGAWLAVGIAIGVAIGAAMSRRKTGSSPAGLQRAGSE